MGSIRVIGLGGRAPSDDWTALLDGRTVLARHEATARQAIPQRYESLRSFDDVLDSKDVSSIANTIADLIVSCAETGDVAYLVPGVGAAGDATVAALARRIAVDLLPGSIPADIAPGQTVRIVDALDFAVAEHARPFDAGLVNGHRGVRTLVTNWYGTEITRLAIARFMRTYAEFIPSVHCDSLILGSEADFTVKSTMDDFLQTVARLRRPDGCPWDREQSHASMLDDLREEVEEVASAIENEDWDNLAEELGDVLLHVAMQAQIAAEEGRFTIDDVIAGVTAKLVRRHPHVFGNAVASDPAEVLAIWQSVKNDEKRARDGGEL